MITNQIFLPMIRWISILVALIWTFPLNGQSDDQRDFLPPFHFSVDSVSLLATWEAPKIVLLDEAFEGDTFPPSGWAATSLGIGWLGVESPEYDYWIVPEHSGSFALTNDDVNWGYDGNMDYFITPLLDLTIADSFLLFFDSYFDGAYGQRAFLEYSLDSGTTWQILQQIDASLDWERIEINLSEFSGIEGESDIQLAFHADDYGWWASGWAVDNVVVYSDQNPQEVVNYRVFLDSELVGQVNTTHFQYSFEFSSIHDCGVLAHYEAGNSDTVRQTVCSSYFPKPDSLTGCAPDDVAILEWTPPVNSDYLIGYNLYRNGMLRAYVYCTEPECCYFIDPIDWFETSIFHYEVTALYELSEYGFPGEIGESLPDKADVVGCCWNELDFFEDWDYSTNYWKFSDNWIIDPDLGNEAPCVVFSPDSVLFSYQDSLQTFMFPTFGLPPLDIILEFDVSLSSVISSGDEKLLVQVYDYFNQAWNTVITYDNAAGSFGWHRDTINITNVFNGDGFRIRFKTRGENSADINYWAIDNIAVRTEFNPPENVDAIISPTSEDSIMVSWEDPLAEISEWREWDDGDMNSQIGIGVGKSHWFSCAARWTPEQLSALKGGKLTSVGFIPTEGGTFYKIAIWTGENSYPFYTQAAGNLDMFNWNYIELDQPMNIDITKDLLVGYRYSQSTGFSMSVDDGPAEDGYGNLIQLGLNQPWETLLEANPELDYNWNIKAYFERDGYPAYSYKLFRSLDGSNPEMIAEIDGLEHTDTISPGYNTSCYKLKSIFYNYESVFSEEACVILTSEEEFTIDDGFLKIYPNPASDLIHIQSSEKIQSIFIYDSKGDKVIRWEGGKVGKVGKVEIPMHGLASGLYLVKVETGGCVVSGKVVIRR